MMSSSSPSAVPGLSRKRVAIIGGGISGLAAAYRLHELLPQAELALFESSNRLGGILDTVERDGFLIERSADNFLATPAAAVDLCRQLGMESELLPTNEARRRAFVVSGGRLQPIPEGFYLMSPRKLWPLLRSPVLSIRGKLRLLAEPLFPRGQSVSASSETRSDESVAAFARRRLGREVFERLVQPLVAGIYTADPEKLSMAATMPQFLEFERRFSSVLRATLSRANNAPATDEAGGARYGLFKAPAQGMQSLVARLASRLPPDSISLNTQVTGIAPTNGTWSLSTNPKSEIRGSTGLTGANSQPHFDAVILAAPAYAGSELLESVDKPLAVELAAIEYAGCVVASFGFHRHQIKRPLDGFGFVVPHVEKRRIIAASFASLKFPGRAPTDDVVIRVFLGGAMRPELLDLADSDIQRIATDELADLLHITGLPLIADIARWPHSMPQYQIGHLDRVARIEQRVAQHPTLALAGNAYRGVGIPYCIASGQAAAERIARSLNWTV